MSYLVLARKWRPRTFPELLGQDSVVRALRFALSEGRVHHAYLFSGIRGVGKTTVARLLAKALNCEEGMGPEPCGKCSACQEIDAGRFADLIEVDAASRTKVDDTRELLDNVQYAPTRGRYKVYLVDEVHMLSAHSFNALLKTLEEPPPHVKFILATTDPQKLPVTVLSRCQKFTLRRLTDTQIRDHMAMILREEGLEGDGEALAALSRAADGSVRDALSLLDQAIAAGGGAVRAEAVRDMLGAVAPDLVHRVIGALADGDGPALLAAIDEAYSLGVAPEVFLGDIMRTWHDIAIAQALTAESADTWTQAMAQRLAPEAVQLYYEIGCLGRRQMDVAPDPETGLRMTVLRMLAFRPASGELSGLRMARPGGAVRETLKSGSEEPFGQSSTSLANAESGPAVPVAIAGKMAKDERPAHEPSAPSPAVAADMTPPPEGSVLERLALTGLMRHIAMSAVLDKSGDRVVVTVNPEAGKLLNKERIDMLKGALCAYYKGPVVLEVVVAPVTGTPTHMRREAEEAAQRQAREALAADPGVAALKRTFNARVNENSVRPRSGTSEERGT
ncbi:DNA polymerase III subunit gamma/tau [Acidiferrobacter sp.]|uniref:DNA polymerase III subunit gamma/tau n=1 Tax=Acidiferrobacter sp. TaxID=1872107 RepID=UPI0026199EEF|nr:DNA polymerase III subunit gamma/tau [Acidiferrobacter sp.]